MLNPKAEKRMQMGIIGADWFANLFSVGAAGVMQ